MTLNSINGYWNFECLSNFSDDGWFEGIITFSTGTNKFVFGTCAIGWLFYNLNFQAYVCVIGNIMEITSTTIALIRETKRKNRKRKNIKKHK